MPKKCSNCGMENEITADVCKSCGAVLSSNSVQNQTKKSTITKNNPYKTLKKFALAECYPKDLRVIRVLFILLYVSGALLILLGIINIALDPYDLDVFDKFIFVNGAVMIVIGILLQCTYSLIVAIIALVYVLAGTLWSVISQHKISWTDIADCVLCTLALIKTLDLYKRYKSYKPKEINKSNTGNTSQTITIESPALREGYRFVPVPPRVFVEKTDAPGNYCCPYCYAEISSKTSSMSVNSNPQPEKINLTKSPSPVAEQASSPDVQVDAAKIETAIEPKPAPVSESSLGNQAAPKNKKIYIIIGAAMLVVIAGLVSVIIYLMNSRPAYVYQTLPSETQYEKVEVPVYNYEQPEQIDVAMDLTLRCTENLRLRASDDFDSEVIITMNSGTKVKVLTIGKQDEVDGVKSNWVQVEVLPGGKDKDLNRIQNGTTGWCFGGFLESCTKN